MAVPLNHKNHSQHKSGKSSVADFTSYYKSKGYKVVKDTFVLSPDGQNLIKVNPKATGVLSIPNKVTTISYRAFSDCKLSAIVFPKSLQSLGEESFIICNVEIPYSRFSLSSAKQENRRCKAFTATFIKG